MHMKIYDGAESIGGTKIYVSDKNSGIFLDFGLNFQKMDLYFKEFLQMRSSRGINDPIEMDILPRIDIYRRDLIPSDISVENFESIKVDAILISHAHADHFGNIGFVDFGIPIAASSITLAIIKAISDCGHVSLGMDAFYSSTRKRGNDNRVLETLKWRDKNSINSRGIIFLDEPSEKLIDFMATHPNPQREVHLKEEDTSHIPFETKIYPVDHSIYGASAYLLEGDTTIAYTGDIRTHGENGYLTLEFAKNAKNTSILIIEGTRTSREEHKYITEDDVKNRIKEDLDECNELVIVDFSSRNFERLKSIEDLSRGGRDFIVTEKDFYMLYVLRIAGIDLISPHLKVYRSLKNKKEKWITHLEENTDLNDRYVDPSTIRGAPENYVLAFSLYEMPNLLDIKVEGGLYIYSSTEALSEEQSFDFVTLYNWIKRFNFRTKGFYLDSKGKPVFEKGYHASGHASPEDLRKIIEIIDPDIIIPVHTLNPYWFKEKFGDEVKILKNGESLNF